MPPMYGAKCNGQIPLRWKQEETNVATIGKERVKLQRGEHGRVFFSWGSSKASADYRAKPDTMCLCAVNLGKTNMEFIAH